MAHSRSIQDRVHTRKKLCKEAEGRYPGRKMEWINGVLYFSDGTKEKVPGVREVPKPGSIRAVVQDDRFRAGHRGYR